VIFFLHLIGQTAVSEPENSVIGIGSFRVSVAAGCSGVAGIGMVSAVMAVYILAFRERLKLGPALLLIPFAAGISWVVNSVRIAALLMIGAYVSPELAVNGFHTYAGWLAFCALSALMLLAAENTSWIRKGRTAAVSATPLLDDPVVAQIAPFAVLLVSSLLAGAIFIHPESGYPFRLAVMATTVFLFFKHFRAKICAVDVVSLLGGMLVALIWLAFKAGGDPVTQAQILGPASLGVIVFWVLCRIVGTVLFVPFIEEMFFRGYLLQRLDFGGRPGKVLAVAISSILFGALHSNLVLASASGVVFSFLCLRRGRIFDAVAAHATANGLIAAWALWTGNWAVI
jgi:exosortase E/protease (VPEID-CTERM system)